MAPSDIIDLRAISLSNKVSFIAQNGKSRLGSTDLLNEAMKC